jgi:ribosomal protein L20A (L18A)
MSTLEQKVIGLPDVAKEQNIRKIYNSICENARALFWNLEFYLGCPDKLNLPVFFEFLKTKDAKAWLYERFIEYHQLTFPGINIQKVIELEQADVPKADFENLLTWRKELLNDIQKTTEVGFYFPIIKLFNYDEDYRMFAISTEEDPEIHSDEVDQKLYLHVRKFTQTEEENKILDAVQKAVDSFNELVNLGIIRNDKQRWHLDLENLIRTIVFSLNEENPLSIHPQLSKFKGFRQHFQERGIVNAGRLEDLLKIELPIEEDLPEEMNEDMTEEIQDLIK